MSTVSFDSSWGFGPVLDLIDSDFHATSHPRPSLHLEALLAKESNSSQNTDGKPVVHLGSFEKLFAELGIQSAELLTPVAQPEPESGKSNSSDDGRNSYDSPQSPTVKLVDYIIGNPEIAVARPLISDDQLLVSGKGHRQARKKAAKERKVAQKLEGLQGGNSQNVMTNKAIRPALLKNPDLLADPASIQSRNHAKSNVGAKIQHAAPKSLSIPVSRNARKNAPATAPQQTLALKSGGDSTAKASPKSKSQPKHVQPSEPVKGKAIVQSEEIKDGHALRAVPNTQDLSALHDSHAHAPATSKSPASISPVGPETSVQKQGPICGVVTPRQESLFTYGQNLIPRTVQPVTVPRRARPTTPPRSAIGVMDQTQTQIAPPCILPRTPNRSHNAVIIRSRTDRHLHFFERLLQNFPEEKKWLVSPMQLCNETSKSEGIHCFVDASNILIGFKEQLRKRGVGPFDMSFDSLALLLERRRPVAKRVFAGSHREAAPVPQVTRLVETSRAVGYESNVKEQVFIRREETERKRFFKAVERVGWTKAAQRFRNSPGGGSGSGSGSGSDSERGSAPPGALSAPKWVEQGVDEILHLKMCQSIIDVEAPTTMVLATGDGNEAEHSDGFLAHVERALKRGWKVELVSWRQQMSGGYRNPQFCEKWKEQFTVIELDGYLESLIDTP